jgi:hypothetical protein
MSQTHKTVVALMQSMSVAELETVAAEVVRLLAARRKRTADEPGAKPGEVERRRVAGWCYVLQLVNCGKGSCKVCGGWRYAHGPYWYGYRRVDGRMRSIYVGRVLRPVATDDGFDDEGSADLPDAAS